MPNLVQPRAIFLLHSGKMNCDKSRQWLSGNHPYHLFSFQGRITDGFENHDGTSDVNERRGRYSS